jgi:hypothetical protein
MRKLGERNYLLISQGVKATGTYDPNEMFFFFEESLYINQADTIWNFLEWVHKNGKSFGSGNYEIVFKEFLSSPQ